MNWLGDLAQRHISENDSVLSLGCGICAEIDRVKCKDFLGVDIYQPYIDVLEKRGIKAICQDVMSFESEENSYDVVLLLDVVEHLEKEKAVSIIESAKRICRKKVIVYTPQKFTDNETQFWNGQTGDVLKWLNEDSGSPYFGLGINKYQKHRSLFLEKELKEMGFSVSITEIDNNLFCVFEKKKISIIIPSYNHPDLLNLCLESLEKQKILCEKEIIVVDDGDESLKEVCDKFKDLKYIKVKNESGNRGLSVSVNRGFAESTGDVIVQMGRDIFFLDENAIDNLVNVVLSGEKNVAFPRNIKDDDGSFLSFLQFNLPKDKKSIAEEFEKLPSLENKLFGFCFAYSRETFLALEGYDEDYQYGIFYDDNDFADRLKLYGCEFIEAKLRTVHLFHERNYDSEEYGKRVAINYKVYEEKKKRNTYKSGNGFKPHVNHEKLKEQDSFVYEEIFERNDYHAFKEDICGKNIVDIGGCRGFFSILCHEYGAKEIFTYEPNVKNYQTLSENVKDIKNIKHFNKAVFDGKKELVFVQGEGGVSNIRGDESKQKIEAISLEDVLERLPKDDNDLILKMDVEGSEFDILLNAQKEKIRRFSKIFIEIHGDMSPDPKHTVDFLRDYIVKELGFKEVAEGPIMESRSINEKGEESFLGIIPNRVYKYERKIKTSIVIPTYNHLEDNLKPCLESIVKYTNLSDTEVLVVANGCTDGTKNYINSLGDPFKLIWFDEGLGYTKATNRGMEAAQGDYIVLLNDDTILLEQNKNAWLDILRKPFENDLITGITGPVKFFWDCGGVNRPAIAFWCAMISRNLINKIGLLDEIFNPGMGEDGDYSIKAEQNGFKLARVPHDGISDFNIGLNDFSFPIYHRGSATFSNYPAGNEIIERNRKILSDRYGDRLEEIYKFCLNHPNDINELFPTLRKYASQCNHITEMGVRGVFSTYAFLVTRPKRMVCYDIETSPNIQEAKDLSAKYGIDFDFREENVLQSNIEETDLLFIDTLHNYKQLSQELSLHANKVKKYILLHDTETNKYIDEIQEPESKLKQGLELAIQEFLLTNKEWKIIERLTYSNGLAALERTPSILISIVIPTHNHLEDALKPCLEKVFRYTDLSNKEIIVVPNGCVDGTKEYLESLGNKITTVWLDKSDGAITPVNEGIKAAKGEYVVLIDNDSFLLEQPIDSWINILMSPFLQDKKVGVSGPFIHYYEGIGNVIHSGCAMYLKKALEEVGGGDTIFGYGYFYDPDLSLRIKDKGYKIVGVPQNVPLEKMEITGDFSVQFPIYHPSANTTMKKNEDIELLKKNREILYARHSNKKPKFSIVIPTFNHLEDCLKPCLESIVKYTNLNETEVVVVANGCTDGTKDYVNSLGESFNLLWFDESLGYTKAANEGIKKAQGEHVILLNNDIVLLEWAANNKWIDMLFEPFKKDKMVGVTGPSKAPIDQNFNNRFLIFFCVMIKKRLFDEIGLLDESLSPGGGEDYDFCMKVEAKGYKCVQVPHEQEEWSYSTEFPIYHAGEQTVHEVKNWEETFLRNCQMLKNRDYTKNPKVSVIIPTYNHLEDCLKPCLDSIMKHTDLNDEIEILVVANGCTDGTKKYVEGLNQPSIKLVWFEEALGYTKSTNEGMKVAQGDYIVLLNNDTVILDHDTPLYKQEKNAWIKILMEPFEKDSTVGISGPLGLHDDYADYNVLIFFCVMIKRELIDKIGLLDESYSPGGGEDIDYCVKAELAGYRLAKVPESEEQGFTWTNIGSFPIYHAGEGTFNDIEEYGKRIIKENGLKNLKKYNKHIKLNIGSGGVEFPGYISVDKIDLRAQLIMDACDLDKHFEENSVEEILASHLFEHINPYQSLDLLKTWLKVLKPNGKLIMEVPNIEEMCKDFVTANKEERYGILNVIYGAVNTTNVGTKEDITSPHLWGWYPEIMQDHLSWAGYTDIQIMPEQIQHPLKNFRVEAKKPSKMNKEKSKEEIEKKEVSIAVELSTKGRYNTTLPLTLMSIANQTFKPVEVVIFDDNKENMVDLRENPLYLYIFSVFEKKGIQWKVIPGVGEGQVKNHQIALDIISSEWIFRVDDDEVLESNVLEVLASKIESKVGAIAGLILDPNAGNDILTPNIPLNTIETVSSMPNIQWMRHNDDSTKEVEHLYSSFLYRKEAGKHGYCLELSPAGHREETIFSAEMKLNGWKLLVTPQTTTWHFRNPEGGIRTFDDPGMWEHDEKIFEKKKEIWGSKKQNQKLIVLDCGIGDHIAFSNLMPEIMKKYEDLVLAVCYPDVFEEYNVKLISIADAKLILNNKMDDYCVYKWMGDHSWNKNIVDAFKEMYLS